MVLVLVTTMTTMSDHSLPRHLSHARTNTHTHAPHSIHATHAPRGLITRALVRASHTWPCWIEAHRKLRKSGVPAPARTSNVRKPTLRHHSGRQNIRKRPSAYHTLMQQAPGVMPSYLSSAPQMLLNQASIRLSPTVDHG